MIKDGICICDRCGVDQGEFVAETGNHAICEKAAEMEAALNLCVMFLTNVNAIDDEAQAQLIRNLQAAELYDLADAVAAGGFAAMVGNDE